MSIMGRTSFSWIPFYTELTEKLLEYKDKREELVEFIFSEDGLREFSDYLHLEDKKQKIDDIDPFSFMGMFNRGSFSPNNRIKILTKIKQRFDIVANVPSDFDGIPVLNYSRMFFYNWHNLKDSCDTIWSAFEQMMNGDISQWFDYYKFQTRKAECTMPLFWCKADEYIALDSRNRDYLESIGVDANVNDVDSYKALLQDLKDKMESGQLKEKSFAEISYNAYLFSKEDTIRGLVVRDSTGWIENFSDDLKEYGVIWKHQLSDMGKVLPQLSRLIENNASFDLYNIANNITDYKFSIVDFATEKDYKQKKDDWSLLNPCWFCEDFFEYNDGNKKAKVVFLVNKLNKIKKEDAISYDDFITYKGTKATIQNAVAYTNIKNKEQKNFMKQIQQYTKLLELKKNIILQGAPGTGKTYNTAALALSICGESVPESHDEVMQRYDELQKEGRIGFCTFHQSMDYEDFVEGIKPIKPNEGEMFYKVEDGIFKRMAVSAEYAFINNQKQSIIAFRNFDERWNRLVDLINEKQNDGSYGFKTKSGTEMKVVNATDNSITLKGESAENATICYKNEIEKLWNVFGETDLDKIKNFNTEFRKYVGGNETAKYAIIKVLQNEEIENVNIQDDKQLDYQKIKELVRKLEDEDFKNKEVKNYVLIIDEINRGNVSRIFGELITLLEKDKRLGGEHPIEVTLPYSKESFGVPENLYIIGTMNTTDRSVGNIDYAVRRRFAFATLQSKRDLVVANSTEKAAVLFDAVKLFIEKHKTEMDFEDLMVGHSYFFAKDDDELALRWQYEILPLLNEYIKDDILRADRLESNMSVDAFI